jgi:NAD(P)-dependent dehydrogenase (short-subunit alcohol dehydrogenase family)
VLINNAGIPKRRHALNLTGDVVDHVMAVNYASPIRLTLALLPRMIERGAGRIVTISSVAARFGPPREAAYSASKAALSAFMESLAVDLDGTPVKINLVNPGIIDTPLFQLPDNEPSLGDLEPLPVETMYEAIKQQLETDEFEIYVPDWLKDIAANRYGNLGPFIEGSKQYTRERVKQMEAQG